MAFGASTNSANGHESNFKIAYGKSRRALVTGFGQPGRRLSIFHSGNSFVIAGANSLSRVHRTKISRDSTANQDQVKIRTSDDGCSLHSNCHEPASVSFGSCDVTSYLKDELVCLDLATDTIGWRRHYSDGYADSLAITPDGKTLYVPCATVRAGG